MISGRIKAIVVAAVMGAMLFAPAASQAVQFDPNPWRGFGFLNMAHQGGESEAPSNTMFAFKSAIADRGADTLELDVNLTEDNRLLVIHDDTVNRTTEETRIRSSGFSEVNDLTLAEIRALDNAYSFETGGAYNDAAGDDTHPYRGIGCTACTRPAPDGYAKEDFVHPTLEEVLDAFPNTPINIEIKMVKIVGGAGQGCQTQNQPVGPPLTYCDDAAASMPVAEALAGVLNSAPYASRDDILVVSFAQELVAHFNSLAPHVAIAPGVLGVAQGLLGGTPSPDVSAFQIPPRNGFAPMLPEFMIGPPGNAQQRGYAVHVFTENDEDESAVGYTRFTNLGVEGVMTSYPARLHAFLCTAGIRRPDGSARCPAQDQQAAPPVTTPTPAPAPAAKKCKKGKKLKKGKCVKKKKKKKGKKGKP